MEKLTKFVAEHINDDISRLILNKDKWKDIDIDLAISTIASRRKLKGKVQEWYENEMLVFPFKLSAEQCSSSPTGRYKAMVADYIARKDGLTEWKLADLTGGLGVDSWFFSQKAANILYNEMQPALCDAARHNFNVLSCNNIIISNSKLSLEDGCRPSEILGAFKPDIIYMDPARRGEGGKKVFLIEECSPDVLTLKDELFNISRHILIKLSPMADITMVCKRLGSCCREVRIVSSGGECKELLIWMDKEWDKDYSIHAIEIHGDESCDEFTFTPSEEKTARPLLMHKDYQNGVFLFEPGKSLMKAGAFNLISEKFQIYKIGTSTHYYIFSERAKAENLIKLGKVFSIKEVYTLDKRSIKTVGKLYPRAEVRARNLPIDSEGLRKKLGVTSGDDAHIFGLKSDSNSNLLIVAERL